MGATRAAALSRRMAVLRLALSRQWAVADRLGAHLPTLREVLASASLLHAISDQEAAELQELVAQANWAKHAAPPGLKLASPMPRGLPAESLD